MGLGLYLTQNVLRRLGGKLSFKSNLGTEQPLRFCCKQPALNAGRLEFQRYHVQYLKNNFSSPSADLNRQLTINQAGSYGLFQIT